MGTQSGDRPRIRNITELAKLAGVSPGTVSRALAGKNPVHPETRERIETLAREHGFRPNQMASRLRTGHTGLVGIVTVGREAGGMDLTEPALMTLQAHLAGALARHGYELMMTTVDPASQPDWLDRIVASGMIDGVLVIGDDDGGEEAIERIAQSYLPLVVAGSFQAGQKRCAISAEHFTAGRLAARHLLDSGRRRLVFVGRIHAGQGRMRLRGAQAEVAAHGDGATIDAYPMDGRPGALKTEMGEAISAAPEDTDGILASSDLIAMAALRVLRDQGRDVPASVSVIGFGDLPLADLTVPLLTTIRDDLREMAETMVETLLRRISGEEAPSRLIEPGLIARESA